MPSGDLLPLLGGPTCGEHSNWGQARAQAQAALQAQAQKQAQEQMNMFHLRPNQGLIGAPFPGTFVSTASSQPHGDTWPDYIVACVLHAISHDRLTPAHLAQLRMQLACDLISAAQSYVGGPLVVAESPGQSEERQIAEGVQKMCDYLKDLKVVPPHVEQLGEAVDKAKRDRAALRAMKGFR
jgi:hypothetical protein